VPHFGENAGTLLAAMSQQPDVRTILTIGAATKS
jgi:hypothetical protein